MSPGRILIVDDNRDLAENVAEILGVHGYGADVYEDPKRALAEFTPGVHRLAILDLRMRPVDGAELFARLRHADPALLGLVVTAFMDPGRVEAALRAGVTAVIAKPFDLVALQRRVRTLMDDQSVLIVEDDSDLCRNLCEALAQEGVVPIGVGTCREARQVLAVRLPGATMVDIRLPDGDGLDLTDEFARAIPDGVHLVFSGQGLDRAALEDRARRAGARFLEKPLGIPELLALLPRYERRP